MIKVFDNIFPPQLVDYIEKIVLHNPTFPLYYTHNIAETLSFSPGLNSRLYEDKLDPNLIFTENREHLSTFNEILYRVGNYNNFIISRILRSRIFIHLPSPNPGLDQIHVDQDNPHFVCLYYINDSDGDTILFENDKKTIIKKITPKKGRCVLFNGLIPHCSSRPSNSTRAVINFNFFLKNLDKK